MEEDSGTRGLDGNWISETPQAKIRNKLSPFWVLSDLIADEARINSMLSTQDGVDLIKKIAIKCQENKTIILDLLKQTEK